MPGFPRDGGVSTMTKNPMVPIPPSTPTSTSTVAAPPAPPLSRRLGVLQPLFSMRSNRGWGLGEIGDLPRFARWAGKAGLSVLQLLPVNELTEGETSPYSAATAFALDPVYLSLEDAEDFVAARGLASLTKHDRAALERVMAASKVAWGDVRALKRRALDRAFAHFVEREWRTDSARARALSTFIDERRAWLPDYALFRVQHDRLHTAWWDWPRPIAERHEKALEEARAAHAPAILQRCWVEWQLHLQWTKARAEVHAAGVALKGDLPFMVAGDSADVWSLPHEFQRNRRVGTPPDAFSATGQDWGLPAYDWDVMRENRFRWFEARAARAGSLYDLFRVDHVIGLFRTYSRSVTDPKDAGFQPADEPEQIALGNAVLEIFKRHGEVVAEDLGFVPSFLPSALARLGVPGYRVLRWEKDYAGPRAGKFHDPAVYPVLSVATTGTHDIEPIAVWYDALPADEKRALHELPGLRDLQPSTYFTPHVRDALLKSIASAGSELVILPYQDFFGARDRVNVPGTVAPDNWTTRMPVTIEALEQDTDTTARLRRLAVQSERVPIRIVERPQSV
ncbi:MAG TPA: 4-alpha-glucanotransferase [Polyangia bacterium]